MASGSSNGVGGLFENAEVTTSGRPVLRRNEVECFLLSSVDLDSEDDPPRFTALRSGNLILTTHRLIWIPSQPNAAVPSSVPLAAITHIFSHKKSIKSMFHSPRIRFQADPGSVVVTIVFRGKGDFDGLLTKFWECWRGRAWEAEEEKRESETSRSGSGTVAQGLYGNDGTVRMVGLAGILRKEQEQWESTDKSLQDAFQDLNALMVLLFFSQCKIILYLFVDFKRDSSDTKLRNLWLVVRLSASQIMLEILVLLLGSL